RMASVLLSAFKERKLDLFNHPQLLRDCRALMIVETSNNNCKLDATRSPDGSHSDTAFALALAMLDAADRVAGPPPIVTLHVDPRGPSIFDRPAGSREG